MDVTVPLGVMTTPPAVCVVLATEVPDAVEKRVVVVSLERVATVSSTPPMGPLGGAVEFEVLLAAAAAYTDWEVELLLGDGEGWLAGLWRELANTRALLTG